MGTELRMSKPNGWVDHKGIISLADLKSSKILILFKSYAETLVKNIS